MINEIKKDAQERMQKTLESLSHAFGQIRTGKAHPSILGSVMVPYYGADTPLSSVANVTVKDSRTLQVVAFERNMLAAVDKAIQSAGLNLNPTNLGELLLISMPALTEETRKGFTKQAVSSSVPRHVAIIMDGNNRWAKKRFMPGVAGHKAGVDAVRAVIEVCAEAKVEVLTLFAFSSENWQRPAAEVSALMDLFFKALRREAKRLNENNISLRIIGDRSRFHPELQAAMREAEAITAGSGRFVLQIAANYGGQWDIAQAAQRLAREVQAGHLQPEDITPDLLQTCLVTGDLPLPDLCIRTGGEHRISNFLLWQLAYSELYFSDLFWPDFKHEAMRHALADFASRQRRFGKTSEQVEAGARV